MAKTVEEIALQTYQENMEYFKNNHQELYQKLTTFEEAINIGAYQEKLALEYKKDGKYFDILNLETNEYIYNKNSNTFGKKEREKVSFNNKDNAFNTFVKFNYVGEVDILNKLDVTKSMHSTTAKIIQYIKQNTPEGDKELKFLPKMMFIGSLLGTHIKPIIELAKVEHAFIVEPNIEIFRLSLFVTNYKILSTKSTLYFSIMDDDSIFTLKVKNYKIHHANSNYTIKFHLISEIYSSIVRRVAEILSMHTEFIFTYNRYLNILENSAKNINKSLPIINFQTETKFKDFSFYPVLVLGAGPSLEKNIEWLKYNQGNFIIVAVGATLRTLLREDIIPDIITELHPESEVIESYENIDLSKIRDSYAFLPLHALSKLKDKFNKDKTFFFTVDGTFKENFNLKGRHSIGETTLDMIGELGAKDIYLLGLDFALDQDSGATHSSNHAHVKSKDLDISHKEETKLDKVDNIIEVSGNFSDRVKTTYLFGKFLDTCNVVTKSLIDKYDNIKIYNLSDGAKINFTTPTKIDALNKSKSLTINKESLDLNLKNYLESISSTKMTDRELSILEEELETINFVMDMDRDKIIEDRFPLMKILNRLDDKIQFNGVFSTSMINYTLISEQYISFFLNDSRFSNKIRNEHIENINRIWLEQIHKFLNKYKEIIELALNKHN